MALMHLKYIASLVAPGEAVGVLAAQGVGEPSTQMTLNTFHLAGHGGANVTLGIPRLREIIMTASDKISTPVMELPLVGATDGEKEINAYKLAARLDRITLSSMCGSLKVRSYLCVSGGVLRRVYKVKVMFHPIKSKKLRKLDISLKDFTDCIDTDFCPKLNAAIIKHHKHLKQNKAVVKMAKPREEKKEKEDEEKEAPSALPGSEREDKDGRKKAAASYEGPDDDEKKLIEEMNAERAEMDPESDDDDVQVQASAGATVTKKSFHSAQTAERRRTLLSKLAHVRGVTYDDKKKKWAEVTVEVPYVSKKFLISAIAREVAENSLIRSTPGIAGCFTVQKAPLGGDSKQWMVQTDGVNFSEVLKHSDLIDTKRICCNDIHAISKAYGVEAVRGAIVREITGVFGVYGIKVNPRHLGLLADYMTQQGGYKPLNRLGMDASPAVFQKISYETSMGFILDAAMRGDVDRMVSPSSRLVVGQPARNGTGRFDLMAPVVY